MDQRSPAADSPEAAPGPTPAPSLRSSAGRSARSGSRNRRPPRPDTSAVKKNSAKVAKYALNASTLAVRNRGTRRNRTSSNGYAAVCSHHRNAIAPATVTHSSAMTCGEPKPALSASMTAKASAEIAAAPRQKPVMSTRCASGSEFSGSTIAPAIKSDRPNDQVEPEDRSPVPGADQRAAQYRPHRQRQPRHRGPDPERPGPGRARWCTDAGSSTACQARWLPHRSPSQPGRRSAQEPRGCRWPERTGLTRRRR